MQWQVAVGWRESEGILQLGKVELLPNTFKQKCTKSKYSTEAVCHSMISHNNIGKNLDQWILSRGGRVPC